MAEQTKFYILDGYGFIFRAYYGMASSRGGGGLTRKDGFPTGALYVYAQMLLRLQEEVDPRHIAVAFDHKGKTFRHDLYPEYKANRSAPPEDLVKQFPHFREITEAMGWPVVSVQGVEADDVIATIAKKALDKKYQVTLFSGDKDLMALVTNEFHMIDPMRRKTYDPTAVEAKFGVPPNKVADYLSLVGDVSDNIPGMPGVGKKTAAKLLTDFGSVQGILDNVASMKGKMKERFEDSDLLKQLSLSQKLVALKEDVELPLGLEDMVAKKSPDNELKEVFTEFEFFGLLERMGAVVEKSDDADVEEPAQTSESLDVGFCVLKDKKELGEEVAKLLEDKWFAIHGVVNEERHDRESFVGLSLSSKSGRVTYIPLGHRYLGMPKLFSVEDINGLEALFRAKDVEMLCHDVKNLQRRLLGIGLVVQNVVTDTMLQAYLVHGKNDVADPVTCFSSQHGGVQPESEFLGKGKKRRSYETLEVQEVARYCAQILSLLRGGVDRLHKEIKAEGAGKLYFELDLPVCEILAKMERRGILLDLDYLHELNEEVSLQLAAIKESIFEMAGESFNLGSPKQLSHVLFEKMKLVSANMRKNKTGFSTDSEVLSGLKDVHPIGETILRCRELMKLQTTYLDALPPLVNKQTGRLHTLFNNAATTTGRFSSQSPNLQNIPIRTELGKKIRKAFVSKKGHVLVSADYSQIELRVVAHLSEDPGLLNVFGAEGDVHTQTAAEVFGLELGDVTQHERRIAKAVNYGLMYGQTGFGLSKALDIPIFEAKKYIERYFSKFSILETYMKSIVSLATDKGFAETMLGRKRFFPELKKGSKRARAAAERMAQNAPIQGTAADIMKLAMVSVDACLKQFDSAELLLTVHDELIVEVSEGESIECSERVKAAMENVCNLKVPLVVDVGVGKDWCAAH